MKKFIFIFLVLIFKFQFFLQSKDFIKDDIIFWIGEGEKEVVFIIDWKDNTDVSSYAWGYRFDGEKNMENLINEIAEADGNLIANIQNSEYGSFLNDLIYDSDNDEINEHNGIAGDPDYWSTWSGNSFSELSLNSVGISETILENNMWFACSYGFTPEAIAPDLPIPAIDYFSSNERILKNEFKINIFPNPFCENISISIKNYKNIEGIFITDIYGKLIFKKQKENSNEKINLKFLKKGNYFVKIKFKNKIFTKKIIKM